MKSITNHDPQIPHVKGLKEYITKFPNKIVHSKTYRTPELYRSKRVVLIGNSASGHDIVLELASTAHTSVYQSRRTVSRWDGKEPPPGIEWKPIIKEYLPSGRIILDNDTYLDDIDTAVYCTGYLPS